MTSPRNVVAIRNRRNLRIVHQDRISDEEALTRLLEVSGLEPEQAQKALELFCHARDYEWTEDLLRRVLQKLVAENRRP